MTTKPDSKRDLLEAAELIERFVGGAAGPWEWDDFTSIGHENAEVDAASREAAASRDDYPPTEIGHWCSPVGILKLNELAARLRDFADRQ